jgi:hypothetical protein
MISQHGTPLPEPIIPGAPPSLFSVPPVFDGSTYEPEHDAVRLEGLLARVYAYLERHSWVTLAELAQGTRGTEASVSARLRDLRKPRYGNHVIDRRRADGGLFQYRLGGEP